MNTPYHHAPRRAAFLALALSSVPVLCVAGCKDVPEDTLEKGAPLTPIVINEPSAPNQPPAAPSQPPAAPNQPPAAPSQPPAEPSQPPAEPSQPPSTPSQPPAEPSQPPSQPGQPPSTPSQPPSQPGQPSTPPGTDLSDMPPIPAGPWKTVTSVSELYTYLHSQPTLTLTQPYLIKAVGFNLDDLNSIGSIYKWTVRYIILDLTESFGTQILSVPSSISQDNQKRMIISLFLPDSVTTINAGGFAYYMGLKTAVMPKVAVIQNEAFNSSLNLETVYMPSVTSIGDTAFKDCRLLKEIVLGSVPPSLGQDVFANVPLGALEIFVPPGSFETYRLHPDWAALSDRLRLRSLP